MTTEMTCRACGHEAAVHRTDCEGSGCEGEGCHCKFSYGQVLVFNLLSDTKEPQSKRSMEEHSAKRRSRRL